MVATVMVEAIKGLTVSFQAEGLEYALKVGHRLALPRPLADRLISAAPDRVRLVEPIPVRGVPSRLGIAIIRSSRSRRTDAHRDDRLRATSTNRTTSRAAPNVGAANRRARKDVDASDGCRA